PPLRIEALSKSYAGHRVLSGVDLEVAAHEAVALLGPNGAGKSTLIGCVCGTVIPDDGTVTIAGHDLRREPIQARRRLRYLPQEVDVPIGLTGRELLEFHADVFEDRGALTTAERLADLGPALDLLATTYSVGMRRRLAFAALACGDAGLYVLDEPFAGLDAASRERLLDWLRARQQAGAGILLAAHESDREALQALAARAFELAPDQKSSSDSTR
ncbi:MAG TPA: ABC transporter ATP-binding protein, partial [Enhygromyxa sp.]|nr:ABC transporter ATP-binding protein [Enhygromyxa sp.]